MYQSIETEIHGHAFWLYLNRPDASNAFTVEMIDELIEALAKADRDQNIRCIVLSGRGKHFCAGGDVKNMLAKKEMFQGESNELRERYIHGIQKIPRTFMQLSTPVVAMINGAAIGAGLDMICMSDIRIASVHAKFGETFVKLGLIPGDGGTFFLQRIVGLSKATEMTLTGDIYSAEDALKMGLISKLVDADQLQIETQKIVDKICSHPPIAMQMTKRALIHAYRSDLSSHLDLLAAYQGITQRTSDHFIALNNVNNSSNESYQHQ
jgi:2-(1,2-epoxy-1,2-dihydrophenyl)acetyl-CoA isomerase